MKNRESIPIAVVGVGCRFPGADDTFEFWDNLEAGRTAFEPIPDSRWKHEFFLSSNQRDVDKTWVKAGSFIHSYREFAALHYGIAPRRLEVMDPQQRLLIEATRWAIQDAGYETRRFDRRRTGVFTGISVSEFKNITTARMHAMQMVAGDFGSAADEYLREEFIKLTSHVAPMRAFTLSGSLTALNAAAVAQVFDLGGPAFSIDSACASASVAIHTACTQLRSGALDQAVAGGAYVNLSPDNVVAFTKIGAISPSGVCRPFDAKADGFVQSDGVGMLFLKRLEDAVADGDPIQAIIRGSGCNNDGRGEGPMTPKVDGQLEVLRMAYEDAGLSPSTVAYFEAHGTATSIGDPVEVEALGRFLQEAGVTADNRRYLGSVKGNIGHAMSAAGVAGVIKAIQMLGRRRLPPQPNFSGPNPALRMEQYPLQVAGEARELTPVDGDALRIGVSSFGFGGTNSHLVLEAPPRRETVESRPYEVRGASGPWPEAVLVTAPNTTLLQAYCRELADFLETGAGRHHGLADVAYTLNARRKREKIRAVVGARTRSDLLLHLRELADRLDGPDLPEATPHISVHEFDPKHHTAPRLAFLFPGQGAQKTDLLRSLRDRFSTFALAFDRYQTAGSVHLDGPLADCIYPASDASEDERTELEARLRRTEVCQPALSALSLALVDLLESFGVRPQVSLGHSLGEFCALAGAGSIDREAAVRLVADRGHAMASLGLSDPGRMAAVMCEPEAIQAEVDGVDGVVIANVNHPRQCVISGRSEGIQVLIDRFVDRGLDVRPLPVSHAFHSPLLKDVGRAMAGFLAGQTLRPPNHSVASCVSSRRHGDDVEEMTRVLTEHATAPVLFTRGLEQTRDAGADAYVQVGAGTALLGFVRATLGPQVPTFPTSQVEPDGGYELLRTLLQLDARGVDVDFEAVYAGEDRRPVSTPETPLEREEYWPVKDRPQPSPRIQAPVPEDRPVVKAVSAQVERPTSAPSDELVALFREQTRLLQQQAQVLAEQTRALTLSGAGPEMLSALAAQMPASEFGVGAPLAPAPLAPPPIWDRTPTPTETAPVPAAELAPEPAPAPTPKPAAPDACGPSAEDIERQVFQLVARVSAFPEGQVHGDQRLVDELGFDSLMVGDLSGAIEKTFPDAGGLPQSLFSLTTTVGDISRHLIRTLTASIPTGERPQEPDADDVPARRYEVGVVQQPAQDLARHAIAGEHWLVVDAGDDLGRASAEALAAQGATVTRILWSTDDLPVPDRVQAGTESAWPASAADALAAALRSSGIEPDGLWVCAGLEDRAETHLERLHAVAAPLDPARIAVITRMGGRLGLDGEGSHPEHAGLAGYAKSLARERPKRVVRVLDLEAHSPRIPDALEELLSGNREVEVGLDRQGRWIPALTEIRASSEASRRITGEDVVMITGGAGSIGSQVALRIATHRPKGVILVGRRAADEPIDDLLGRLSAAGATAVYVQVDLTQPHALRNAIAPLEERLGPVTVAIHSAGVIEDAPAPRKTWKSMSRVLGVKLGATREILDGFPALKDLVLFSSWAGRYGNAGQVDYAAANDLLDHMARSIRGPRTVSIAWPPWSDTPMVQSIPEPIRRALESQGVTFLGMDEGLDILDEVLRSDRAGIELVGRDMARSEVARSDEERFELSAHPYLEDHQLKGQPVVPMASVLDWVAWTVGEESGATVVEDLELVRGIRGDDVCRLQMSGRRNAEGFVDAQVELEVEVDGSVQTAYRGRVRTAAETPANFRLSGDPVPSHFPVDDFYQRFTFHGPRFRGIERVDRQTTDGIEGWVIGSDPKVWMPSHRRTAWAVDPLIVDAAFQLAGYWTSQQAGRTGYPIRIERLVQVHPMPERVHCTIRLTGMEADRFRGDILFRDADGRTLASLEGVEGRFAEVRTDERSTAEVRGIRDLSARNGRIQPAAPRATNGAASSAFEGPELEVDPSSYDVSKFPELEALDQRFQMAELMGLKNPYFRTHMGTARDTSVVEGVEMVNFSSYNYLGFSGHPEVVEAANEAIHRYGTSVSASRVASGERPLHRDLEQGLADHIGVKDALVFVSGHATNVTTVGHLLDRNDLVLHDALIHDSVLQGIYLSGATRRPFGHNDFDALERSLAQIRTNFRRVLIVAEGIYSMDGDTCDLPRLIELKKRYKSLLMIDEAHSIGVLGHQGRGIGQHFDGVDPNDVDIWMGTMSKSFASCGGYIAGSEALIRYLKYTAPGFVYSAGLPPPNAAAALKSLELMQKHPEVVEQLRDRSRFFLKALRSRGINTGDAIGAAVVPAIIGNSLECLRLSEALAEQAINVQPIVYPAVEDDAARLRFFISSTHTEAQLERTAEAVRSCLDHIRSTPGQSASL